MQVPLPQSNPWSMGPSLIGLGAAVHSKIVCCTKQVLMLFEQHPYFVRRRSRASGYRRPCSSRVWSASRVGTLPSFFRAGRRLYRSWTVHQCWCSISTVDSFSFLILAFVCHAYPAFVLHPRFHQKPKVCSLVFGLFLGFFVLRFDCSLVFGLFLGFVVLRLEGPKEIQYPDRCCFQKNMGRRERRKKI